MKKRIFKLLIALTLILVLGSGYAFFGVKTGLAIPCMIYKVTGLYCPGCGISRMFLSLLEGNIYQAFFCNPFVFCLLPFLFIYFMRYIIQYIRGKKYKIGHWESILWKVLVLLTVLFGVLRNIPAFSFLSQSLTIP